MATHLGLSSHSIPHPVIVSPAGGPSSLRTLPQHAAVDLANCFQMQMLGPLSVDSPLLSQSGVTAYAPDLLRDGFGYFYLHAMQVRAKALTVTGYTMNRIGKYCSAPAEKVSQAMALIANASAYLTNIQHRWLQPYSARMLLAVGFDAARRATEPPGSAVSPDPAEAKVLFAQYDADMKDLEHAVFLLLRAEHALLELFLYGTPFSPYPSKTYLNPLLALICWFDSIASPDVEGSLAARANAPAAAAANIMVVQHTVGLRRSGRFHGSALGPSPHVPNAPWSTRATVLLQNICNASWAISCPEGVPVHAAESALSKVSTGMAAASGSPEALVLRRMKFCIVEGAVFSDSKPFLCRAYWQNRGPPSLSWLDRVLGAIADATSAYLADPATAQAMKPQDAAIHLQSVESVRAAIEEFKSSFRDPPLSRSLFGIGFGDNDNDDAQQLMPLVDDEMLEGGSADEFESLKTLEEDSNAEVAERARVLFAAIRRLDDLERRRSTVLNIIRALTTAFR